MTKRDAFAEVFLIEDWLFSGYWSLEFGAFSRLQCSAWPRMTILIAPDKFKGSLTAREVAANIEKGLRDVLPDAEINSVPMADGGEETAEVMSDSLGGRWMECKAHDALGRPIDCRYASIGEKLAVMEMSEAAGLRRLDENERDPLRATTFGVGEMILDAARRGMEKIIIGLGGSATNDGGFGMARALGFRFFAEGGLQIRTAIGKLSELKQIDRPANLSLPVVLAAVDVQNPLLGKHGATRIFGGQKGAGPEEIDILEGALKKLASVAAKEFGCDYRDRPGAGAAGGLGFGLMIFCGAEVRPGFEVVAEAVGLEGKMREADVVITGEGKLDSQTLDGKTPAGVARMAKRLGKRAFAIVGGTSGDGAARGLFEGVYELMSGNITRGESIAHSGELVRERARELAKQL